MHDPLIPFNESGSLAENLVVFYDEFVEFQAYCALLCDALSCMAVTEMGLDDATQRGVTAFSGCLKRRVEDLKISLKKIQEKSCEEN
ncbi:MAG: hypothetical protein EOO53_17910 [Gammaproteobacteria bacterium]|nr:MAG: hypothetical protein EOO53_17910 [Gammaproteobacteria bacterium]